MTSQSEQNLEPSGGSERYGAGANPTPGRSHLHTEVGLEGTGALEVTHRNPRLRLLPPPGRNPRRKRLWSGLADWVRTAPSFCQDWSNDSFRSLQHPIGRQEGRTAGLTVGFLRETLPVSSPHGHGLTGVPSAPWVPRSWRPLLSRNHETTRVPGTGK